MISYKFKTTLKNPLNFPQRGGLAHSTIFFETNKSAFESTANGPKHEYNNKKNTNFVKTTSH